MIIQKLANAPPYTLEENRYKIKIVWVEKISSVMVGYVQTPPFFASKKVKEIARDKSACRLKLMVSCGYNYPLAGN